MILRFKCIVSKNKKHPIPRLLLVVKPGIITFFSLLGIQFLIKGFHIHINNLLYLVICLNDLQVLKAFPNGWMYLGRHRKSPLCSLLHKNSPLGLFLWGCSINIH